MGECFLIPARLQSFSTHEQRVNGEKNGLDGVLIIMGWDINLCIKFAGSNLPFNKIPTIIGQFDGMLAMVKPEEALRLNSGKSDVFFI